MLHVVLAFRAAATQQTNRGNELRLDIVFLRRLLDVSASFIKKLFHSFEGSSEVRAGLIMKLRERLPAPLQRIQHASQRIELPRSKSFALRFSDFCERLGQRLFIVHGRRQPEQLIEQLRRRLI